MLGVIWSFTCVIMNFLISKQQFGVNKKKCVKDKGKKFGVGSP